MAPRIPLPEQLDDEQLAELVKSPRRHDGQPLNLFATLVRLPQLMRRVNALGGYFPTRGTLDGRTRELVILRTAGLLRCEYELLHHRSEGERRGLTTAEVNAAADPELSHPWAPEDRALLGFTEEVVSRRPVSEECWSALDGVLDDDQRLELLILIGFYTMVAGMLTTVGVELDPEPIG